MSKTFFKALEQELDSFCFSMGYEKRVEKDLKKRCKSVEQDMYRFTTFIYSKPITANVEGHLLFIFSVFNQGSTNLFLDLGVLYKDVNRIYSELMDYTPKTRCPYRVWMDYIKNITKNKENSSIEFTDGDNSSVYEHLRTMIEGDVYAYYEKMSCFETMLKEVEKILLPSIGAEHYLPILYYMQGEKEKGVRFIEDMIRRASKNPELVFKRELGPFSVVREWEAEGVGPLSEDYKEFLERYKQLP